MRQYKNLVTTSSSNFEDIGLRTAGDDAHIPTDTSHIYVAKIETFPLTPNAKALPNRNVVKN